MRTMFSVGDLAERWGLSPNSVRQMEAEGKLHRLPNVPGVKFSAAEVHQIESIGKDVQPLTAWERKQKDDEIFLLRRENNKLKSILQNVINTAMGVKFYETDHD